MADTPIAPSSPTPAAPSAAAPSPSALRRALRRVRDGVALDVTEASVLLAARGEQLDELLGAASRVRDAGLADAGRPGVVTYSRKVFVPLTRLCRDRCHYCTFATVPHRLPAAFLERDEVLEIARAGAAAGCKEALFTLGDRPEERWPAAREWLEARGYHSTLEYVRACAIAVLEETGLLPHLNPGVMSWEELTRLKPVAPSMGMMLETTATRLWSRARRAALRQPGQGARRPAAHAHRRRAGRRPVHHRHPHRDRGDARSSGPSRCSRSGPPPARTGTSRRRSSRTSGRSRTPRWRTTRTPISTTSPPRSPSPGWCSARRCGCRPRRTSSATSSRSCSAPGSTTGAASRR